MVRGHQGQLQPGSPGGGPVVRQHRVGAVVHFFKPHWFGDVIQEKKEPVLSPLTNTEGEVGRGGAMTNTPSWLCNLHVKDSTLTKLSRAPAS